ncbi:UPF0481 protein At3g47200-like [Lycium barbarum]|uniref:UPF0481 protein At3g47200-like n=1 Tax=Lycium barbarum TaxID=112863 RepID=UPI00293F054E|nr:UPF0481 protein At3g47200-like [Lycium barbarum]
MASEHLIQVDQVGQPPMPQVHFMMRQESKESEDYDPKVVSLGPYHHGKTNLKFVEDYKPKAVELFIAGTKNENEYLKEILKYIGYARRCYLEEYTRKYTDKEFARMMLQDACVILNYIESKEMSWKRDEMTRHIGIAVYNSLGRDIYLLENQVPFRILEILVVLRDNMDRRDFVKNVEEYFFKRFFHHWEAKLPVADEKNRLGKEALHLIEIFRRVIVTGSDPDPKSECECLCGNINLVWRSHDESSISSEPLFSSVTDLKSKGITFSASEIKSLREVRFYAYKFHLKSAELKLPRSYVTKDTRVFFKNLIAYEFSPYAPSDKAVTSYVNFMRLLVISQEDVKELREKQIIINGLGRDEEVVEMYKALDTFGAEDTFSLRSLKVDIEKYHRTKAKTWMADLKIKYFGSPWSLIALSASIFLIFLDMFQAYYAAHGSGQPSSKGAS